MKKQDYNHNQKMLYGPHHFIFLPLMSACILIGIYKTVYDSGNMLLWLLFAVLSFCILYLAIMLRQHYALGNQDRIVRLECRLRYFELTGKSFAEKEKNLSLSQITALRFAGDEEFVALTDKAINEKLKPDEIKKMVKNWQPDYMRL